MSIEEPQSLHPNLARLAASYDDIVTRFGRSEIGAAQARTEIMALVARDDEGTQWSIDPDTAKWRYRDRSGALVPGSPPAYGYPSPNPYNVSRGGTENRANPDNRISFVPVDEEMLYPPGALTGSTRRYSPAAEPRKGRWTKWRWVIFVITVLVILLISLALVGGGGKGGGGGSTTTTTTTLAHVHGGVKKP